VQSHYEVLGVEPTADVDVIKRAWHVKVLLLHPDKHAGASEEVRAAALTETRRVNDAWGTLRDPLRRHRYDLQLAHLVDAATAADANSTGPRHTTRQDDAVHVVCAGCDATQRVVGTAERFLCTKCKTTWRFVVCTRCHERTTVRERWGKWGCGCCGSVYTSYWGGAVTRIKCVGCKSATEVALGSPIFHCRGCRREYLRCECGAYTSFHVSVGRHWRYPRCRRRNLRAVDPEVLQTRSIQRFLNARGIDTPGAARALAGRIGPDLDGVARVGTNGDEGVIAVAGDRAAVWWTQEDEVERLNLREFNNVERYGRRITLRSTSRPQLRILASNDEYADGWMTHMVGLGATATAGVRDDQRSRSNTHGRSR
jgi:hypothetical protein